MSLGQIPVVERIARELLRRLELLIDSSTHNTQVVEVIRPKRIETYSPRNKQIVLTEQDHVRVQSLDCPGNPPANARQITFNIRCHIINDEKSCEPIDTLVHMFAADVENVVVGNDSQWYTFGNLSMMAEWQTEEPIASDGAIDGVNLPITITYRTTEGNPYEVRG
jgi:hypothetical protein